MRKHTPKRSRWLLTFLLLFLTFLSFGIIYFGSGAPQAATTQAQGSREERVRDWLRLPEQIPPEYFAQRGLPTPPPPAAPARVRPPSPPVVTPPSMVIEPPVRPTPPPLETAAEFHQYVEQQKAMLQRYGATRREESFWAGITFKRPLNETELDRLLERHRFTYTYFEFVASNGVHGGYSRRVAGSLSAAEGRLQQSHPHVQIQGIVYVVGYGRGAKLVSLDGQEEDVLLVDLGPLDEINRRRAKGKAVAVGPPPNLYHLYRKFTPELPPMPTPAPYPSP